MKAWELWKDDRGSELIDPLFGKSWPRFKVLSSSQMDRVEATFGEGSLAFATSGSRKRTVRGRSKCTYMQRLADGEKFQVLVSDGQLVEKSALEFSTWLGTLAKDGRLLPIDRPSWKEVEDEAKDRAWKRVQVKVDIGDEMKRYVLLSLAKKWRDYKCELKRKWYVNCPPNEDLYEHHPINVLSDQWHTLIHLWDSEEGKKRSERNKRNRSCQKLAHTAGTKSFARVRHEEHVKRGEQNPPSRAEVFLLTHSHKDGTPVNEVAAEKICKMKEFLSEDGLVDKTSQNDVYWKVMGPEKSGRVRGLGLGPTPTSLWGSSSSRGGSSSGEFIAMKEKICLLEELLNKRDVEMVEQQKQRDEQQRLMGEQQRQREAQMAEQLKESNAQITELKNMFMTLSRQLGGNSK